MMRWLVTGGCGFIGTALVSHLLAQTSRKHIFVLDNLSVGSKRDLGGVCDFVEADPAQEVFNESVGKSVTLIAGDILDAPLLQRVAKKADVIVHLAANTGVSLSVENPRADCMANVIGTLNVLEAARLNKVNKVVFASSGAPIGECEPPIHEEMPAHPVSPYGASKLAGEAYCSAYARTFGVETVCLRFGNVYGPRSAHKSSVVAKFIGAALTGKDLEIYGNGKQTRDFIYIDDLIEALLLAVDSKGTAGEVFQIATNSETTIDELVERLKTVLAEVGIPSIRVRYEQARVGDVLRNFSDTSKAQRILGWRQRISLDEGLRRTAGWFLSSSRLTSTADLASR